ncbi:hypothetical protein [Cellulomonas aerilata]|uniref:Uncharacterized protein n=1 Tax=Cellulomonas aerilata TaxID=515326 RepID=A0A512DFV8_9CELL|nr:hypothetical protein [Cellulomonas aerilata]GEO35369.1 hypothetical protein CAE01nite_30940 [Cellulomonas aerilata]
MTTVLDGVDRAALARAALARAEQRTGARSGLRVTRATVPTVPAVPALPPVPTVPAVPTVVAPTAVPDVVPGPSPDAGPSPTPDPSASTVRTAVPSRLAEPDGPAASTVPPTSASALTHPDRPPLPVTPVLAPLLPEGALRRGSSLVVTGSTSLVLALVARASQEGSWVALVGLPGAGLLAAQQAGVVLDRLALVPRPGPDAPTVLAALLDGVDLVIVGDGAALVDSDRRRLTARARERGAVLLSTAPWTGANVVLAAEPVEWTGLGDGHGHLRRHRMSVTRGGRGSAGRGARVDVVLPVRPGTAAAGPAAPERADRVPVVPLRMVG